MLMFRIIFSKPSDWPCDCNTQRSVTLLNEIGKKNSFQQQQQQQQQ